jgi:hypothetical protein
MLRTMRVRNIFEQRIFHIMSPPSVLLFFILCMIGHGTHALAQPSPNTAIQANQANVSASPVTLYGRAETYHVRVAAATCAALSMTASLVTFYWFWRMEKRFRHR